MKTNLSSHGVFVYLFSLCLFSAGRRGGSTDTSNLQAQSHRNKQNVDLIIKGDHIVSMDSSGTVYKDAAIAVDEGVIVAIGPANEILSEYQSNKQLGGRQPCGHAGPGQWSLACSHDPVAWHGRRYGAAGMADQVHFSCRARIR